MSDINYVKVDESNTEVQALAKAGAGSPKEVAAMINADRYRKAYNKNKLVEQRRMREFFKQHPEMMPKA